MLDGDSGNFKDIFSSLNRLKEGSGHIFQGALHTLEDINNPDRVAQAAHSIREVLNVISRLSEVPREIGQNQGEMDETNNFRKRLMSVFDPLGGPPPHIQNSYKKLVDLHSFFTGVSHHSEKRLTEAQFLEKVNEFEVVLSEFFKPYFEIQSEINKLLLQEKPTKDDVRKLKELIKHHQSYIHFFNKADERWLAVLKEEKFFRDQPLVRSGDMTQFLLWPESRYLLRIADKESKEVCDIISRCRLPSEPMERNPWVVEDFIDIAIKMDKPYSSKLTLTILRKGWLQSPYISSIQEKAGQLATKLLEDDPELSFRVIEALLEVRVQRPEARKASKRVDALLMQVSPSPIESKINYYSFEQTIKKYLPSLITKDPLTATGILVTTLSKLIQYEYSDARSDLSDVWRPAIEDHEQNYDTPNMKSLIVTALRNTILEAGKEKNILLRCLEKLKNEKYTVYRRLELYAFRVFPDYFSSEIKHVLIKFMDNVEVYHEHYLLVKEQYPNCPKSFQNRYIREIYKKTTSKSFLTRSAKRFGSQKKARDFKNNFILTRMEPVAESLPARYKSRYAKLVKSYGKPSYAGFLHWHSTFTRQLGDGKTELDNTMQTENVLQYIKSYKVQDEDEAGFYDATAYKFQQLVADNALEYSKLSMEVLGLHRIFSYSFLWGLSEALQKKKAISWTQVIELTQHLLEERNGSRQGVVFYDIVRQLAEVYNCGLSTKEVAPNFSERAKVWKILTILLQASDAERMAGDAGYSERGEHSWQITINSTRGTVMQTIMEYANWCNTNLQSASNRILVAEVKELLSSVLDPSVDNSVSTRAVLGFYMPRLYYLDKDWFTANVLSLLSFKNQEKYLSYAMWDSFLMNNVWRELFPTVSPYYKERIGQLKADKSRKTATDANNALAEHVAKAYIYNLEEGESLFNDFVNNAPQNLIEYCINYVGRILQENKQKTNPSLNLLAIKDIWENQSLITNPSFGLWFVNSPFEKEYSISRLQQMLRTNSHIDIIPLFTLPKELIEYAKDYPLQTLDCLHLLIKLFMKRSLTNSMRGDALRIIELAQTNNSPEVSSKITEIANFLGTLGFDEFRHLK